MTLQVPFEDFAFTAARFEITEAYVLLEDESVVVSAGSPKIGVTISSQCTKDLATVRRELETNRLAVYPGIWSDTRIPVEPRKSGMFVAAVSYKSGHPIPGLWMDAYLEEPSHTQVLEALYAEFRQTGEMPDVPIEEFIRTANPNVVVLAESRLHAFIVAKQPK